MSSPPIPPYDEVKPSTALLKLVDKGKVPREVYDQCVEKVQRRELAGPYRHNLKGRWKVRLGSQSGQWRGRVRIEDNIALIELIHPRGDGY